LNFELILLDYAMKKLLHLDRK